MRRRRRYYRSNRDRWHGDYLPRGALGTAARWAMIALLILAGLVVLASIVH